jgi:hypothetical protein
MAALGLTHASPEQLVKLKRAGVDAAFVELLRAAARPDDRR